jgi:hypothetical protein
MTTVELNCFGGWQSASVPAGTHVTPQVLGSMRTTRGSGNAPWVAALVTMGHK